MQQLPTFNFGLTKFFLFIYRTLSMRQKTKNYRIKGSNAKKKFYFFIFHVTYPYGFGLCKKREQKILTLGLPLTHPLVYIGPKSLFVYSIFEKIIFVLGEQGAESANFELAEKSYTGWRRD
jgi:hypothetical protein